jgi:hypothetical protein
MAARVKKIRHDDETRAKIQTSQLINRLSDHVFGKIELSSTQVRSAEILLKKTIPDLTSTEASVAHSGEIQVRASKEQRDAAVSAALRANTDA